jgi:hypothetical protein
MQHDAETHTPVGPRVVLSPDLPLILVLKIPPRWFSPCATLATAYLLLLFVTATGAFLSKTSSGLHILTTCVATRSRVFVPRRQEQPCCPSKEQRYSSRTCLAYFRYGLDQL